MQCKSHKMGTITGLCVKETMIDVVVENEIAVYHAATQTVPDMKCTVYDAAMQTVPDTKCNVGTQVNFCKQTWRDVV